MAQAMRVKAELANEVPSRISSACSALYQEHDMFSMLQAESSMDSILKDDSSGSCILTQTLAEDLEQTMQAAHLLSARRKG